MSWFHQNIKILEKIDPKVAEIIKKELLRQELTLELIASENFVTEAIMQAEAQVLTNKYAEGYPGKRYYGGCENYDLLENLAIERAKKLFSAEHANVQPHSGSQANMAVYFAFLEPGNKVLAMDLSHGGHLTHGSPINFSGKLYKFIHYGVEKDSEVLNYEKIRKLALLHRPKIIVAGASAYPRKIDFAEFRKIADEVGAYLLADIAHIAGLIVAGLHPDPVPYADFVTTTLQKTLRGPRGGLILCKKEFAEKIDKAVFPGVQSGPQMHIIAAKALTFLLAKTREFKDYQKQIILNTRTLAQKLSEKGFRIVSGGTDNHLLIVDLRQNNITGKEGQEILEEANIVTNKNTIPFDSQSPFITSGIRLGTPCVTSRGMKEGEMEEIALYIQQALEKKEIKQKVIDICKRFPIYE
ncbi:MAG: serine hydroxymethyltransferase [Parcubacteria group bacterium]|nr:serine hydroxymethyltransferase [Parcubacteria group bacterium]